MDRPVQVLVCDSTEIERIGIARSLNEHGNMVVSAAPDAATAIRLVRRRQPDVVLVDTALPEYSTLIATLVRLGARVIATGPERQSDIPFEAIRAGAVGYVAKDLPARAWVAALTAAIRGEAALSRALTTRIVDAFRDQSVGAGLGRLVPHDNQLTRREWEILACVAEGKTNRDVARELCISIETVRSHVSSILAKLGTPNRSAAAVRYHQLLGTS